MLQEKKGWGGVQGVGAWEDIVERNRIAGKKTRGKGTYLFSLTSLEVLDRQAAKLPAGSAL